jgi:hypothetical protein
MQYDFWWLLKGDGKPDPWVRKDVGLLLCPEHVMAIRNTKLEENATSRILDWLQ